MTNPTKSEAATVDRVTQRVTGRLVWRRRRHLGYRILALLLAIGTSFWFDGSWTDRNAGENPALTHEVRDREVEREDESAHPNPRLESILVTERSDHLQADALRSQALRLRALQLKTLFKLGVEHGLSLVKDIDAEAASLAALEGLRILANDRALRRAFVRIQSSGSVKHRVRAVEILAQRSGLGATRYFWDSFAALEDEPLALDEFTVAALPKVLERFPRFSASVPRGLSSVGLRSLARVRHTEIRTLLQREVASRGPEEGIIDALGEYGDEWSFGVLARWSQISDQRGTRTLRAIARIPGDQSLSLLLERFSVSDARPREMHDAQHDALLTALRLRSTTVLDYLRSRIESRQVRDCEILAVSKILPESFSSAFGPKLRSIDSRWRGVLCRALSSTATPDAIAALIDGLSVAELRFHARRSLGRLSGRDFGNNADRWKLWYGRFIKQAAVESDKSSRPEASMGALSFSRDSVSSRLGA